MGYYRQGPGGSYGSRVSVHVPPLTPMVKVIVIACVAVWLVQVVLGRSEIGGWLLTVLGLVPRLTVRGMLWQPLTYMFLHSPEIISHILFNMLILWMIGADLERRWGSRAFLRYYLVCGAGAGVLVVVLSLFGGPRAMSTVTIGASGAIYALILAYGMLFSERVIYFMMIFPMRARTFAILLFVIALFSSMTAGGQTGVSHVGHIGGMVIGYLYLKRAWRLGEFYRELRWKLIRRRFKVIERDDRDRWTH